MSKEIKDYLHLYLGCEVQRKNGVIVNMNSIALNNMLTNKYEMDEYKLLLRKLSDMSEEEAMVIRRHKEYLNCFEASTSGNGNLNICAAAFKIKYLLSKHFDLFNLIPEGLAIDASTLKK